MRFLCLHGMGTSGAIFSAQTSAFRAKLDPQLFTFDFVDAPFECAPAAGVDVFFPPPNYTFWRGIDPTDVRAAHEWLLELLDRDGPYDGVICFSQGCALISSFILYHNCERPEAPLPFKAAMFICGGIPLGVLADLGLPVSSKAWAINERTGRELHAMAGAASEKIRTIMEGGWKARKGGLWDGTDVLKRVSLEKFPTNRRDLFGLDYTRFPATLSIKIPTVHVYGSKDPRYPSSTQLAHFSNEENRRVYDHAGGHEIPRTTVVSETIADLVRWLELTTKEQDS